MLRKTIISLAALLSFFTASFASAQVYNATPYWCGSYWSSQPCYGYNQYSQYSYGYPTQYAYPQPSCTITYSYTNNPNSWNGMYSDAIQLSWSSSYATSAYINAVGSVSPSGTRVVYPSGYAQYDMTVYGPGGSSACHTYYQPRYYYQPSSYYQYVPQYNWGQMNYNYGYPYYW